MNDLINCPKCNSIFVKNAFRDVCQECWKEEEKAYETVYDFMRIRENRAATIQQIVDATEIDEDLIYKFIRTGRLKTAHFPNLGYPCDHCGSIIQKGQLCDKCQKTFLKELQEFTHEEERKKKLHQATYYSDK